MSKHYSECGMCGGKEWMTLEGNPLDKMQTLVAPCLGCSSTKNLNEIQDRRGIKLVRNDQLDWVEVKTQ